jgi:hypothetical protein
VTPIVAVIVCLLTGQALPAGLIAAALPANVINAARAVDSAAATVAAYAPAVCAATDGPLDRVTDDLDAASRGKVTTWRRVLAGLTAAADTVCAGAAKASTPAARAKLVIDAAAAVARAEATLDGVASPVAVAPTPRRGK